MSEGEVVQTLVSTVPGTYAALLEKLLEACNEQEQPTALFDFAIGSYEPGQYVIVQGFMGPTWVWEGLGTYEQREKYTIHGYCSVFSGETPFINSSIAVEVLNQCFDLFQQTVAKVMFSNRNMPILGAEPTAYEMKPREAKYSSGPGEIDGAAAGWEGILNWAFDFSAIIKPE
jgi:hypothetical protein